MGAFGYNSFPLPRCGYRERASLSPESSWTRPSGYVYPGGNRPFRAANIYSYRSGFSLIGQIDNSAHRVNSATSLSARLASRNRMYSAISQSLAAPDETNNVWSDGKKYTSVDLGHDFWSVQVSGNTSQVESTWYNRKGSIYRILQGRGVVGPIGVPQFVYEHFRFAPNMLPYSVDGQLQLAFPVAAARDMMSSLVPKSGGLGETLVELLSLNIPSLLSSLRRTARFVSTSARPKRISTSSSLGRSIVDVWGRSTPWLKAVGSDYLEVAFGLLPVIEVFLELIALFPEAADRIYGDSFRRRRRRTLHESVGSTTIRKVVSGRNGSAALAGDLDIPVDFFKREQLQITLRATALGRESLSDSYYSNSGLLSVVRRMGLLSPSLGWEILPFSWLSDWFINFSSGLKRRTFFEDVYPVDYVYATYRSKVDYVGKGSDDTIPVSNRHSRLKVDPFVTSTVSLVRRRLDPFGSPWQGISIDPYKAGVLAALGLINIR